MMILSVAFSFSLVASVLTALVIVSTQHLHGRLTHDSHPGVQKLHKTPTPRVGGVAIFFGMLLGGLNLPAQAQSLWWMICLAALPAFGFGLLEDITKRVGVKTRLLATVCAGLIFSLLTGYQITRTDIPGLDFVFSFWLPSLLFTAFAIGGIANAINIIDGVNGLASGTSIIILSGFAVVAHQVGDLELLGVCLVAAGALGGFFLLNFPMGRIFLGDAGAYTTGFILAVIAIALPQRNPELSPLLGLLALSYPVTETMVSIHRRMVREGTHPGQADRLHLHSLIYRSKALRLAHMLGVPQMRNGLTGLIMMSMSLLSVAMMVVLKENTLGLVAGILVLTFVYILIYRKVALLSPFRQLASMTGREPHKTA